MHLFGLKTCDTCKKAAKALGVEVTDVRQTPLTPEQIARFHAAFGDALVNRRSTTWRNMSEEDRAASVEALVAAHPSVMKRPVIESSNGSLYLGWSKDVQSELGL